MKNKLFVIMPIVAVLTIGSLSACAPDPTVGQGLPEVISQNSSVQLVNATQPDPLSGTEGLVYMVTLDKSLTATEYVKVASDITKKLAEETSPLDNWGIKFRSGNREMGMSQSAYIQDYPEYAPKLETDTTAPVEESPPTPEEIPQRLSYEQQILVVNAFFAIEGTKSVKTYDSLSGYVDVNFPDQLRFEEYFNAGKVILDESGWKHRGDFSLNLQVAIPQDAVIASPNHDVVLISGIDILQPSTVGLGSLLAFPETALAMYRSVAALVGLGIVNVNVYGRGVGEEIAVTLDGSMNADKTNTIYSTFGTIVTPDSPYVRISVSYKK